MDVRKKVQEVVTLEIDLNEIEVRIFSAIMKSFEHAQEPVPGSDEDIAKNIRKVIWNKLNPIRGVPD